MDCIDDLYTAKGWDSVALSIAAVVAPEIFILVAVFCGIDACEQ